MNTASAPVPFVTVAHPPATVFETVSVQAEYSETTVCASFVTSPSGAMAVTSWAFVYVFSWTPNAGSGNPLSEGSAATVSVMPCVLRQNSSQPSSSTNCVISRRPSIVYGRLV